MLTCIWIGGGDYPNGGFEFNLAQDIKNDGYTMVEAPYISEQDITYSYGTGNRPIRVYHKMDVRLDLEDLFAKLEKFLPNCAIKYAEVVKESDSLLKTLTRASFLFAVLLRDSVFIEMGFNAME